MWGSGAQHRFLDRLFQTSRLCFIMLRMRTSRSGLSQSCRPVQMFCQLDVRDLTRDNQAAFSMAIVPALDLGKMRVASHATLYLELFSNLAAQINYCGMGGRLEQWPNLNCIAPHSGDREGPGWSS
jgi:hypothetical protein